jgi:hypothetical protein
VHVIFMYCSLFLLHNSRSAIISITSVLLVLFQMSAIFATLWTDDLLNIAGKVGIFKVIVK